MRWKRTRGQKTKISSSIIWVSNSVKHKVWNMLKISSQLSIFGENKVREQLADDRPLRPPDMNIHKYRFSIFHNWQIRNLPFVHSPDKLAKDAQFETRIEKSLISSPVAAFPRSELRLVEGRESKRDNVTSIMTLKEHIHIDTLRIWVWFCRTGKMAVSHLFFLKSRRLVWANELMSKFTKFGALWCNDLQSTDLKKKFLRQSEERF